MNRVRLYSNGTAIISRDYPFAGPGPLRISIPVRKADLDDVISSLAVFGDAAVTEPPTYTPTNAGRATLDLDPAAALGDLVRKLAGAAVEVEAGVTYAGRLVGLHPCRREVDGAVVDRYRLVILTERGIQQVDESSVTALRFAEAPVRAEVDKALRARLGRISPDSSKVELTVRPNPGSTGATIAYATPVAAWKIRYQLRVTPEGAELDGQAVVDNDTDDDWSEAEITVITGEPITFSTDLAEVRRPARTRVNIVAEHATGAVVAEPDWPVAAAAAPPEGGGYGGGGGGGNLRSMARRSRSPAPGLPELRGATDRGRAEQPEAEVRESGDFSLFTSPGPVSVGAGKSAIIPLFRTAVGRARPILLYREQDDPRRPFRAVRFRNEAGHSLGRGVCEVFQEGDFQGKCLLEPTKPGEETLLVHAKETGVRVLKESDRPETRRLAIRISEGAVHGEILHRQRTTYRVQNGHAEGFTLEIEHPRTLADSKVVVSLSAGAHEEADIAGGRRIRAELPAGGGLEVAVVEEQVEESRFSLSASWLVGNLIALKAPSGRDPGIQACIDLQGKVDRLQAEIQDRVETTAALADEQERLMKLIPNGHADQANAWRTDLASAENDLREIKRTTLPKLRGRLKEAQAALNQALGNLRYDWSGGATDERASENAP